MLMLLSPAKSLDFETPAQIDTFTLPDFLDQSQLLIDRLRQLSPAEVAKLMGISDSLALLNAGRFSAWKLPLRAATAKQAVLAFNGDVYEGLDAPSLSSDDLNFAQSHLRIMSGLYGLLRPLDLILPYRLEMGIRLDNPRGKDLYAFWGDRISDALAKAIHVANAPAVINLASVEYFKAVGAKKLPVPVIQPVFEDWSAEKYKVVSFYAKRARGLMARFAVIHRVSQPRQLRGFGEEGYAFSAEASDESRWVFRRKLK